MVFNMQVKISATFDGTCDLCKKKGKVFTIGDEDTKRIVTICKDCSAKNGQASVTEMIEKYGKKSEKEFEPGVRYEGKPVAK